MLRTCKKKHFQFTKALLKPTFNVISKFKRKSAFFNVSIITLYISEQHCRSVKNENVL